MDATFKKACERAASKAEAATQRARDKLEREESKEIERYQKRMREINLKRRSLFDTVYSGVYNPLEEAAFSEAEKRLRKEGR
ncbi:hypothetical protein [Sinorhizobium fredii]|uniref:hypothetical protein n=1 Tax=Rhizobium fredii TaxID=380 RepID=UPI00117E3816|nr:hypothetical protein [Sinorhizobium fredii]